MRNVFKSVFELFASKAPVARAGAAECTADQGCCASPGDPKAQNQGESNREAVGALPPCCGKNSDTQKLQTRSL